MKRTYNLSDEAVTTVRRAVERGAARSQDAFVEAAIALLARRQEEERETALWEAASADPEFVTEVRELEAEFATADAQVLE